MQSLAHVVGASSHSLHPNRSLASHRNRIFRIVDINTVFDLVAAVAVAVEAAFRELAFRPSRADRHAIESTSRRLHACINRKQNAIFHTVRGVQCV